MACHFACSQFIPCSSSLKTNRHKFTEYSYLRLPKKSGGEEHTERSVVFLVDAWSLAQHDTAAEEAIEKAKSAPAAEEQAKKESKEAEDALDAAEKVQQLSSFTREAASAKLSSLFVSPHGQTSPVVECGLMPDISWSPHFCLAQMVRHNIQSSCLPWQPGKCHYSLTMYPRRWMMSRREMRPRRRSQPSRPWRLATCRKTLLL